MNYRVSQRDLPQKSRALPISLWLPLALSVASWLTLWQSLALYGPLWLSPSLVGSSWLSRLTRHLLGSQSRSRLFSPGCNYALRSLVIKKRRMSQMISMTQFLFVAKQSKHVAKHD